MRELKRSVAKANMREAGVTRLCEKYGLGRNMPKTQSVFSRFWRKWVTPVGDEAKLLGKARRAKEHERKLKERRA